MADIKRVVIEQYSQKADRRIVALARPGNVKLQKTKYGDFPECHLRRGREGAAERDSCQTHSRETVGGDLLAPG